MIPAMTIRPAVAADVEAVLPMVQRISALHQSWDEPRFRTNANLIDSYRRWLTARATDPHAVFLVAEESRTPGALGGYLVGTIEDEIPIYWTPRCGWIHDLWVDEPLRRRGVGRRMTQIAIERFRATGVTQIRLQTAAANDAGRRLFSSCGFRVCTIEMLMELSPTPPPTDTQ